MTSGHSSGTLYQKMWQLKVKGLLTTLRFGARGAEMRGGRPRLPKAGFKVIGHWHAHIDIATCMTRFRFGVRGADTEMRKSRSIQTDEVRSRLR